MTQQKLKNFFTHDIWQLRSKDVPKWKYLLVSITKKLYVALKFFFTKGANDYASSLTYSTMLAIVPICAVVFAVARGFGFSKYIEKWFRQALSGQEQAADAIIQFVNSYLVHAQSGVILGVGLVFMLWTVIRLTRTIEQAFNSIWHIKHQPTSSSTITYYLSMVFVLPILIVLISGISIFITTFVDSASGYILWGPVLRIVLNLMPFFIMSCIFIGLYIFMPNTKVKFSAALVPGILSGVAMQLLQTFYIHGQILLSNYNAIYGSFAALPLFMLWMQISWTICLFGVQLCYTNQNLEELAFTIQPEEISHRYRLLMSGMLLGKICNRLIEGKPPYTALQLKIETNIPIRITTDLLYDLTRVHLINASLNGDRDNNGEMIYQPAEVLSRLTVGTMIDRLEALGKWKIDLDFNYLKNNEQWNKIFDLRKHYLDELRAIPIYQLVKMEDKYRAMGHEKWEL